MKHKTAIGIMMEKAIEITDLGGDISYGDFMKLAEKCKEIEKMDLQMAYEKGKREFMTQLTFENYWNRTYKN